MATGVGGVLKRHRYGCVRVGALHALAEVGEEELPGTTAKLGLEGAVALAIRTEAGVAGGAHQLGLAGVDAVDEVQKLEPGAITHERHAHVAVEMTADLGRVSAEIARERGEGQLGGGAQ